MIRAVYHNGSIQPLDTIPGEWREGDKLVVEHMESSPTVEELDEWAADVEAAAAKIPDEDHDRAMAAIAKHREEAKQQARRELGLPE